MTELQNYRMTDRTKTICPPIFDLGGIKKKKKKPYRVRYVFIFLCFFT